jgi:hypothetical protein
MRTDKCETLYEIEYLEHRIRLLESRIDARGKQNDAFVYFKKTGDKGRLCHLGYTDEDIERLSLAVDSDLNFEGQLWPKSETNGWKEEIQRQQEKIERLKGKR